MTYVWRIFEYIRWQINVIFPCIISLRVLYQDYHGYNLIQCNMICNVRGVRTSNDKKNKALMTWLLLNWVLLSLSWFFFRNLFWYLSSSASAYVHKRYPQTLSIDPGTGNRSPPSIWSNFKTETHIVVSG